MEGARVRYAEAYRIRHLEAQEAAWRRATRLTEYVSTVRTRVAAVPPGKARTEARRCSLPGPHGPRLPVPCGATGAVRRRRIQHGSRAPKIPDQARTSFYSHVPTSFVFAGQRDTSAMYHQQTKNLLVSYSPKESLGSLGLSGVPGRLLPVQAPHRAAPRCGALSGGSVAGWRCRRMPTPGPAEDRWESRVPYSRRAPRHPTAAPWFHSSG